MVEYRSGDYVVRPIDGLGFDVDSGQLALLLGASGCGKTTLLSILASILRPVSGSVRLGETEVTELDGEALTDYRRHKVGIVFQAFNLIGSLTASENVQLPLRATGQGGKAARARAEELLEQVGLSDRSHHRPADLSGGQQQRVAIARALALDPPLVLADEPTAHLDYVQVEGVLRVLRGLADEGRVVVVSTHDERMVALADRIVEMQPRFLERREIPPEELALEPGGTLFRQGEDAEFVYVVEEGDLVVLREHPDGGTTVLARLGAGDHVGEMGALFGLPRSATVRTEGGARLTAYTAGAFRHLLGKDRLAELIAGHPVGHDEPHAGPRGA